MLKKLIDIYIKGSNEGLLVPFLYDAATKKPSMTLMFAYLTFILAFISGIVLLIKDTELGVIANMLFWTVATVLYMIRSLQKAKFDLDDRSIELEGEDESEVK